MLFGDAVQILRDNNTTVEYSGLYNEYGRFYRVHEPGSDLPPFWLSVKAIGELAELGSDNLSKE